MIKRVLRKLFRLLYTLVFTYVLILGVTGLVLFFAPELWSPPLREKIEHQALKLGVELTIEKLRLVNFWPLTFRLDNVRLKPQPSGINAQVGAVDLSLWMERIAGNFLRPKLVLGLKLLHPQVELENISEAATNAEHQGEEVEVQGGSGPTLLALRPIGLDIGLQFAIENGSLTLKNLSAPLRLSNINAQLQLPSLLPAWWQPLFTLKADVETTMSSAPINIPVVLDIGDASLNPQSFNFEKMTLELAGIKLSGKGQHLWAEGSDNFQFTMQESNLAQVPAAFLPAGQWQGLFRGGFTYKQKRNQKPEWRVELKSEDVKGQIDWQQAGVVVKGEVGLKATLRGDYKDKLTLDDSSLVLELTKAETSFAPWFHKPQGAELIVDLVTDSRDQKFWLRRALIRLAHLRLEATGNMDLSAGHNAQVDVILPLTSLAGLEKYFPVLAETPAYGSATALLHAEGPVDQPEKINFDLKNLELQRISANVKYQTTTQKINGPIGADLKITGLIKGQNVIKAAINGQVDGSALQIEFGEMFKKPNAWRLKLNGQLTKFGAFWSINQLNVDSQGGRVSLNGRVMPGNTVDLDLKSQINALNLNTWSQVVRLPNVELGGQVSGKLNLAGKYFVKESLGNSQLSLSGELIVNDGLIKYVTTGRAVENKKDNPESVPPNQVVPAWLPPWPLYTQAFLKAEGNFLSVQIQDLKMAGLFFEGLFSNSRWKGSVQVKDLWKGDVAVSNIVLSPLAEPAAIEGQANWRNLDSGAMLVWFNPKLKNYMSGQINGRMNFAGDIPNAVEGYRQLRADGAIQLKNGQFNTFQIEEKINQGIEKLKLKTNRVKGAPAHFSLRTSYALSEGNLNLANFLLSTDQNDQLRLRGLVDRDLNLNMSGSLLIGSMKIGGAIAQANTDKQGRVVVPVQVNGNVHRPDFNISQSTLKTMLSKTVEKEAKDLGEKFKKSLGKDLKEKLKNVFGK